MKSKFYSVFLFPLLSLIFFMSPALTIAENEPGIPTDFDVKIEKQGNNYNAVLSWKKNTDGDEPDDFYVYMAEGDTEELDDFGNEGAVKSNQNKDDYSASIKKLEQGTYSFYVTAVINDEYESEPSEIISVQAGEENGEYSLKITSTPGKKAETDAEWTYEIEVETDAPEDCPVIFTLEEGPDDMTLDEETGEIAWTPSDKGNYDVTVQAYLECDENTADEQSFKINVSKSSTKLTLKIKSKPEIKAALGETYEYTLEVATNAAEDCPVIYELSKGPEDMELDANSGSITWTPAEEGNFDVEIRAYLECDEDVDDTQTFKIKVDDESGLFVKIISKPDNDVNVGEEYSYELNYTTNAADDCPVLFELIDAPEGMELVESSSTFSEYTTSSLTWAPTEEGNYKFEVKAYLECREDVYDVQKVTLNVKKGDKLYVRIVSKPDNFGEVDEQYVYQIFTETNAPEDCELKFEFSDDTPESWELVDNNSFTWTEEPGTSMTFTPEAPGVYKGWLYSSLDCDENAWDKQRIVINVKKKSMDQPCAYIKGNVEDSHGEPIAEGKVMAWRVDEESNNDEYKHVFKSEIVDGAFEIYLSEGTYVVRANAMESMNEWYIDANSIETAERIEMVCDEDVTLDFVLEKQEGEEIEDCSSTFTGTVTSADGGEGLRASIQYLAVDWMYREGQVRPINWKFQTETDEDGNYTIDIPCGHTYIALAVPDMGSGYMNQYYDNVYDPLQAVLLETSSTMSTTFTVDFALEQSEEYTNGFSGTMVDTDGNPLEGRVIAYLVEADEDSELVFNYTQIVETDEEGNYIIANVLPGKYVIFSAPFDRVYVPGFWVADDFVVKKWKDAEKIEISDNYLMETYELKHNSRSGLKGIAKMKGALKRTKAGKIDKIGDTPLASEAVSGAFVYCLDESGQAIDFTFSDNMGEFDLSEMTQGTFTLHADKVGFDPYEETIDIDYSQELFVEVDGSLAETQTSVSEIKSYGDLDLMVYPSPATNYTNLSISTEAKFVHVQLFDLFGTELQSFNAETGNNYIRLSFSSCPSGLYFIKVNTGTAMKTIQIRVIR